MYLDLKSSRCWTVIFLLLLLGSFLCAVAFDETPSEMSAMRAWFCIAAISFAIGAATVATTIPLLLMSIDDSDDE